jgi:hypothetical protein
MALRLTRPSKHADMMRPFAKKKLGMVSNEFEADAGSEQTDSDGSLQHTNT